MAVLLTAVGVTTGIFVGLSVVLLVAQRFLVNYGTCVINVNGGENVIEQPGGNTLLATLLDAGVFIPSACGGKGSCGYCRVNVVSGGGPVLPTELPYLSRSELQSNVRLACQVKVRSNINIFVPDLLETVRGMVRDKTFDASRKWRFLTSPEMAEAEPERLLKTISPENRTLVCGVLARYKEKRGSIVPILQDITSELNYLPEPVLNLIAEEMHMPLSHVCRLVTFYNSFSTMPKGRHIIRVCMGTSCYVKGGGAILEALEETLKIKVDHYTEDMRFSLETVSCIGCCGQSPVISVNDEIYGYFNPDKMMDTVLDRYE